MWNALAEMIEAALDDAANRSTTARADIRVLSEEAVTWSDGSIGCPKPGMMYTQVLTPGYHVVVEAEDAEYDYRASAKGGRVRWCESPPEG